MAENINNNIKEEERLRIERLRKMVREELNEEGYYRAGEKSYKITATITGIGAAVLAAGLVAAEVFIEKRKEKVELKRMEAVEAYEDAKYRHEKKVLKKVGEVEVGTF